MTEKLTNQLYNKLKKEYLEYIENIKLMPIEQIISNSYSIAIRQEFVDMFYGTENYNKYELKVLLEKDNTLDFLYENWIDADGGIHNVLEENLSETLYDLVDEYKNELLIEIEKNPNYELIKDISETLIALDNYDFCYHIKEAFGVEDLDAIDVFEILKEKNGAKYLYDFCDQVRNEKQVQYLMSVDVLEKEKIDNIKNKILPKLKKYINQQEKNKNKDYER